MLKLIILCTVVLLGPTTIVNSYEQFYPYASMLDPPTVEPTHESSCKYKNQRVKCNNVDMTYLKNFFKEKNIVALTEFECNNCEYKEPLTDDKNQGFFNKITLRNVVVDDTHDLETLIHRTLFLDIDGSNIKTFQPTFKTYAIIRLTNSKLNSLPYRWGKELGAVSELILAGNEIDYIHKSALGGVRRLQYLDLSSNRLRVLPDQLLDHTNNMSVILLNNNNIFKITARFFEKLPTLKLVDLSNNPIFQIEFEKIFIKRLKNIDYFHVEGLPCTTLRTQIMTGYVDTVEPVANLNDVFINVSIYNEILSQRHLPTTAHILNLNNFLAVNQDFKQDQFKLSSRLVLNLPWSERHSKYWSESEINDVKCVDYYPPQWRHYIFGGKYDQVTSQQHINNLKLIIHKILQDSDHLFSIELLALKKYVTSYEQFIHAKSQ